ncbi:MAG: DNA polymerase III subunit gamma/tau [Planctomycetota bacterium]
MSYLVLARKHRPQVFGDVLGQEAIARTLENAIAQKRIAHAYLFAGPRGVGKTSMARILAKSLNCEQGESAQPCGKCASCREIAAGSDLDVREIDAASNRGIDHIRDLRDNVRYAPARGRYKIYIIDEVHQLTSESFNALLKTLEEPPPHVKFIFATTEPEKLPETIRSRCQVFEFRRISDQEIAARLRSMAEAEGFTIEPGVEQEIAHRALGGMRDALSLLDLLITFSSGQVTHEALRQVTGSLDPDRLGDLVDAMFAGDAGLVLRLAEGMLGSSSPEEFVSQLGAYLRALMIARVGSASAGEYAPQTLVRMKGQAAKTELNLLVSMTQMLLEAKRRMREIDDAALILDLVLLRLTQAGDLLTLGEALAMLRQQPLPSSAARAPAPPPAQGRREPVSPAPSPPQSPARAAAGTPPPPLAAPASLPSDAREAHAALIRCVTTRSASIASFLAQFAPVRIAGDYLELADGSGGAPRLFQFTDARVKSVLREAAEEAFGRALGIREVALPTGAPPSPAKQRNQALDRAKDLFGGEIVSE